MVGVAAWAGSAQADPTIGPPICPGPETAVSGTYGNLVVTGWKGAWFGVMRNTVHKNVILLKNVGLTISEETGEPDSSEIVTNTISGSLICFGNNPAPQIGDSGGSPNTVGGLKIGQCKKV